MNLEAAWNTYVQIPLPWVRTLGPDYWAQQGDGDRHGPDKYQHLQPESYAFLDVVKNRCPLTDSFLDIGCHLGRHMNALRQLGYDDVSGIDVVAPLDTTGFYRGTFQEWLPRLANPDYQTPMFDIVFTFGMTIELVPPDFPICYHMARLAKKAVILVVQERGVPYPRLYRKDFKREGFTLTRSQNPITPGSGASLFVFERK